MSPAGILTTLHDYALLKKLRVQKEGNKFGTKRKRKNIKQVLPESRHQNMCQQPVILLSIACSFII